MTRARRYDPARHGMTLIELLIGMVITALALTAGYAAFTFIIDRRTEIQTAVDPTVQAAALRRTLLTWMNHGNFITATSVPPTTTVTLDPNSAQDVLQFVTTETTPIQTDQTIVTLSVNPPTAPITALIPPPRGLVALLRPNGGARPDSLQLSLDSSVTGLRVEYLTPYAGRLQWLSASEYAAAEHDDLRGSAQAVRVTLLFPDTSAVSSLLRLPMMYTFWAHS